MCYQTQVCFYDSLTLYGLERLMFLKSQRVWNIIIWERSRGVYFSCLNELKPFDAKIPVVMRTPAARACRQFTK